MSETKKPARPRKSRSTQSPETAAPARPIRPRVKGAMSLVIVESPAKAKTINKFLGPGFHVEASLGHVRDLPQKTLGIDLKNKFLPEYEIIPGRAKNVKRLARLAQESARVYLACDLDREGEAIAWHLVEVLEIPPEEAFRVTFSEITREAICRAFETPGRISMDKVNAQQARRILDRIVGYKLSPLLWKTVMPGLSAGRVQSVALKILAEREKEIRAFVSEEFWKITALLSGTDAGPSAPTPPAPEVMPEADPPGTFRAEIKKVDGAPVRMISEAAAREVLADILRADWSVADVERTEREDRPHPPFITSTLQQQASIRLHFSTDRTMRIAQQLYEGLDVGIEGPVGLITYMRTDSMAVSQDALAEVRAFIPTHIGSQYLPEQPNFYRARKGAQEAHEAIRPTSVMRTPEKVKEFLTSDQYRLYEIIWRRFVASQMAPARLALTRVDVAAGRAMFGVSGRQILFDGYQRVWGHQETEAMLPALAKGDPLACHVLAPSQHFTQPPPRYTEATLVKTLEKEGIGRPSTYATIIETLTSRNYVALKERKFQTTDLGILVSDRLTAHFADIMDVGFTSRLEERLDAIAEASEDWTRVLKEFWKIFDADLKKARTEMKNVNAEPEVSDVKCDKCGRPMVYKINRWGRFLGCSGHPECKNALPVDERGRPIMPEKTEHVCEKCGKPMVVKKGRNGRFIACSGYPECKNAKSVDADGKVVEEIPIDAKCDKCGKPMVVRRSRRGPFAACSGYPDCKNTKPIGPDGKVVEPEKSDEVCEKCGSAMVVKSGRRGRFLACSGYPACKNAKSLPGLPGEDAVVGVVPIQRAAPELSDKVCEICGKPMVIRTGRRGRFLGCSGFPKCRSTLPMEAEQP